MAAHQGHDFIIKTLLDAGIEKDVVDKVRRVPMRGIATAFTIHLCDWLKPAYCSTLGVFCP